MPLYEYKTKTGGVITIKTSKPLSDKEKEKIEHEFFERLTKNQVDTSIEFERFINEHFWRLI